jgi:ribosomal protein S12 methylthiotransferase
VVPYLDVPLQHTHPDMLQAMKRPRHEPPAELIFRMRDTVPDLAIRTTFITGFPGETEEHHEHMVAFVREQRLDHVGVFAYSPEHGTPAAGFKPIVPKRERERRRKAIMREQQRVSHELHQGLVGRELDFLVESIEVASGRALGRTYRDAPEIDGTTYVTAGRELEPGEIVRIRITRAEPYDLHGVAT